MVKLNKVNITITVLSTYAAVNFLTIKLNIQKYIDTVTLLSFLFFYCALAFKIFSSIWCRARSSCSAAHGTASRSTWRTQTFVVHCRGRCTLQNRDATC